jgi:hypothetical protein
MAVLCDREELEPLARKNRMEIREFMVYITKLWASFSQPGSQGPGVGVASADVPFIRTFFFFFLRATTAGRVP